MIALSGRYLRFTLHLCWGLAIALSLYVLYGKNWHTRIRGKLIKQAWMNGLAQILGIKIRISGVPSNKPCLIVCNHISWLDVICINALTPVIFIAKQSVRHWPIIGFLSEISGTLFIKRESKKQLGDCYESISKAINRGSSVVIFPEGTTTDGSSVKNFKSSLFQASIDSGSETQPCSIQYHSLREIQNPAPFIGEDQFLPHLHRILKHRSIMVNVHFFDATPANSFDSRKLLANLTHQQIRQKLHSENAPRNLSK